MQVTWGSQKDLRNTNQLARASPKDIHFFPDHIFCRVTKDHGPQGHPFHRGPVKTRGPDLLPLVWQRGSNEGTEVNHLWTMHYHFGLICTHCLSYFTTNTEAMCCHAHGCKPATAGSGDEEDDREEEDYDENDGKGDDKDNELEFEEYYHPQSHQHLCSCQGR